MKDSRLLLNSVLLCLPALALVGAVAYFLVDKVPEFERNEQRRVNQEYRERAVEAKETGKGVAFDFAASGLKRDGRKIDKEPWGYERDAVWYFKDGTSYWHPVEPVDGFDFGAVFYPAGILLSVLFVALTVFGVRYFWKFVKARDDFLAATAHDLTTPLVGLRLVLGRDAEEARNLNERMLRLVQNLKDFLKLGGRPRPRREVFDLVAAYREAYGLFAADYRDLFDGADVPVEGGDGVLTVRADETMSVQILWNLLGNDLKYAAPYGAVKVRFSRAGGFARVEFLDEGQGMTPRQMRKAFDRYYRAKTVLETGKGGFGIGLCTAREFARAMGGDLTVRANVPKGCVFTLTLPEVTDCQGVIFSGNINLGVPKIA